MVIQGNKLQAIDVILEGSLHCFVLTLGMFLEPWTFENECFVYLVAHFQKVFLAGVLSFVYLGLFVEFVRFWGFSAIHFGSQVAPKWFQNSIKKISDFRIVLWRSLGCQSGFQLLKFRLLCIHLEG